MKEAALLTKRSCMRSWRACVHVPRMLVPGCTCTARLELQAYVVGPPRPLAAIKDTNWVVDRKPLAAALPAGAAEGLLQAADGSLLEGLVTNLFIICALQRCKEQSLLVLTGCRAIAGKRMPGTSLQRACTHFVHASFDGASMPLLLHTRWHLPCLCRGAQSVCLCR